jgi:hypothetical protein
MVKIGCHFGFDSFKSLQILPKSLRIDLLPKTLSLLLMGRCYQVGIRKN